MSNRSNAGERVCPQSPPWRRAGRYFIQYLFGLLFLGCGLAKFSIALAAPLNNLQFDRLAIANDAGLDAGIGPVNAIVQDEAGYIWFGGELGLARYDAHRFVFYRADKKNPHSLSSSFVRDLLVDHDGVLWIATANGLNRYDAQTERFVRYLGPEPQGYADSVTRALAVDSSNNLYVATYNGLLVLDRERRRQQHYGLEQGLTDVYLRDVYVDREDRVWIGTANGGLNRLDPASGQIDSWRHDVERPDSLPFDTVETVVQDRAGVIWVGTFGGGLARLAEDDKSFKVYRHDVADPTSIGNDVIRDLFVDRENRLWVGIDHRGLAVLQRETDSFQHFTYSAYDSSSLGSNSVRSIYEDRKGDLWVGTFPHGVNFVNRAKSVFRNFKHDPANPNSLPHSIVLSLLRTRDGVIWIGTEGGLSSYNAAGQFRHYGVAEGLKTNAVLNITEDTNGDLWLGTWSGGLFRFERDKGRFHAFLPDKRQPGSLSNAFVWKVVRDRNDILWVATEGGGLNRYDRARDSFVHYSHNPDDPTSLSFDYLRTLYNDHRDDLWVGTLNGLNRLNKQSGRFQRYFHDPNDPLSLSSNRIVCLFEDSRRRLWIGTEEGGLNLYLPERDGFHHLNVEQGLPSASVASIVEDKRGYLWVSTSNGIASVHPDSFRVQVFSTKDGTAGNVHNRDAALVDESGRVFLGSTEGLTSFYPEQLFSQTTPPQVVINGLRVLNKPVEIGAEQSPLQRSMDATSKITLGYRDAMFAFDFAALSYRASPFNQYAYKLEGFDSDWNYVGAQNSATYTNISPGEYVFRVKGANSNGIWSEEGAQIRVTVLPPPWKSLWAYLGYACALGVLLVGFFAVKVRRIELEKERRVNAKLVKLDKLKDRFLANTSHELRTPLNGIVGITESLMDGVYGSVSDAIAEKLRTIAYSGRRLSALINDILDYAKLQEKTVTLNPQAVSVHDVVELVFALVAPLAQSKKIALFNHVSDQLPRAEADNNRLQQILLNLVGNAIKYTHKGYVRVFAELDDERIKIGVEDTGVGIHADDLELIFEAFNQGEHFAGDFHEGTGLGLAVSRQLAELHGGKLQAISQVGIGSTFFFSLAQSKSTSKAEPIRASKRLLDTDKMSGRYEQYRVPETPLSGRAISEQVHDLPGPAWALNHRILVVDDDAVNRIVLQGMLGLHHYTVLEAKDGFEALRILQQPNHGVDLVILDIMMPGLNGFQVCQKIRAEYALHELPVIFLTAKDVNLDIKNGFDAGGNEFVAKPVSKYQLLPRIENCLKQAKAFHDLREQLREQMKAVLTESELF